MTTTSPQNPGLTRSQIPAFSEGVEIDPIALLNQDHARIRGLFQATQVGRNTVAQPALMTLFHRLRDEIETHSHLEENVVYPQLCEHDELAEVIEESYDEHREMKDILNEMSEIESEILELEVDSSEGGKTVSASDDSPLLRNGAGSDATAESSDEPESLDEMNDLDEESEEDYFAAESDDQSDDQFDEEEPAEISELYEEFASALDELKELIEYHFNEEEKVLFPKVRRMLSQQELSAIAKGMREALSRRKAA